MKKYLWELLMLERLVITQTVGVKLTLIKSFRFELPTFWFVAVRTTLPNLARGVANRTESASWGKFPQPTFSFLCCRLPHFCRRLPHFALHFRDSARFRLQRRIAAVIRQIVVP